MSLGLCVEANIIFLWSFVPFCGYSTIFDFIVMLFIAKHHVTSGLEHGALGFEDAVLATALLVVVVDYENCQRF